MLLELAAAGASLSGCAMVWAVHGRSSSVFGRSVYRGDPSRRSIALTFDDGPSESTPRLLELLERHQAPATFFCCGENVRRLPGVAREIVQAGHEIGNHADSHARLSLRSTAFIREEVLRAQRTISEATGVAPRLFRAPYGARWFGLGEVQRELGLLDVMWTVIALDWRLPADAILRRLLRHARNGAILCLHDGRDTQPNPDIQPTLEAVRHLLPELSARGFHFETVSQILTPGWRQTS
jgi:peptidoglycan/xylan/chitin deacetylase (PgdA/CDA1 family)